MRLARFLVVGGLCAVLTNVLVIGLVSRGYGSAVASALAFVPVLLIGYTLHTTFTFGAQATASSFARYALATAVNFPLWIGALYLLCDVAKIPIVLAGPFATLLIFIWNYVSARWAFFRRGKAAPVQLPG